HARRPICPARIGVETGREGDRGEQLAARRGIPIPETSVEYVSPGRPVPAVWVPDIILAIRRPIAGTPAVSRVIGPGARHVEVVGPGRRRARAHFQRLRRRRLIIDLLRLRADPEARNALPAAARLSPIRRHPPHAQRWHAPHPAYPDVLLRGDVPVPIAGNPDRD